MRSTARVRQVLLPLVPVLGTLAVFLPVTGAYFHRDDFLHLVDVNNNPLQEVIWRPVLGHLYVVPKLTYALLLGAVGPTPAPFFWFGLVLHLINTALFFSLARLLTGSARIASVMALLWGTSLLHTVTLSYFCLHAHVLVGLAMLVALRGLATAERSARYSAWQAIGWSCAVGAASLSYGTGLVLALTFPFIALLCFRGRLPRGLGIPLWLLPLAVVVIYAAATAGAGAGTYGAHRLQSGLRATLNHPWPVLQMWGHCVLFALSSLGAIAPGLSYASPAGVAVGGALALLLLGGCVRRSASRNWIVALVLFAAACYAVTAVVPAYERLIFRQLPLLKAQDHRYHYAPSLALALALALVVRELGRRLSVSALAKDVACLLIYLLVLWSIVDARRVVDLHDQNRAEVQRVLQQAARAAQAAPLGATVRVPETGFRGGFGLIPFKLTSADIFTLFHPSGELAGRQVRYRALANRPPLRGGPGSPVARVLVVPVQGETGNDSPAAGGPSRHP
jgi:hypothetical protein